MPKLTQEQQLLGLRKAYRTLPALNEIAARDENTKVWIGTTKVLLQGTGKSIDSYLGTIQSYYGNESSYLSDGVEPAHHDIQQALTDAIVNLDFEVGSQAVAVEPGNVFDYFNETRKILGLAKSEIFLIDPYVDADIVSDYFTVIDPSVKIRILTSAKPGGLNSIKPAVEMLNKQNGISIEIRSVNSDDRLHDRFWIIDNSQGFHSSSSVRDGGKKSAAVIMEVRDIFTATQTTYENLWANGDVQINV